MSNLIPPLLSTSPPPIGVLDDDDEFGDFTTAVDSYGCDYSASITPESTPKKSPICVDINRNSNIKGKEKDYQDKRKEELDQTDEIHSLHNLNENIFVHNQLKMPNNLDVPNIESVHDLVTNHNSPDKEEQVRIENKEENVPSFINSVQTDIIESDDVYREEPPEIIPDDCDDDFTEFEFNPIPVLENEVIEDASLEASVSEEFNEIESNPNYIEDVYELPPVHSIPVFETIRENIVTPIKSAENYECDNENFENETEIEDFNVQSNNLNTEIEISHEIQDELNEIEPVDVVVSENSTQEDSKEFAEFANFELSKTEFEEEKAPDCEEEFGDFVSLPTNSTIQDVSRKEQIEIIFDDEDDFGDFEAAEIKCGTTEIKDESGFGNFEKQDLNTFKINSENIVEKAEVIIKEMFLPGDSNIEECSLCDFTSQDYVFKEVKDITETNALTYIWSKSKSQKGLLKALNIDTRNILYGHGLNSSVPKFAANLGLIPLEPMKSEASTVNQSIIPSIISPQGIANTPSIEIPAAQFDWNESGLANPLDSTQSSTILLDLEQLVASLDISSSSPPRKSSIDMVLDDWDDWLQSISQEESEKMEDLIKPADSSNYSPGTDVEEAPSKQSENITTNQKCCDNESVNSLQFSEFSIEEETPKGPEVVEFNEFISYQSFKKEEFSEWSTNMVPLRESYINNTDTKKIEQKDTDPKQSEERKQIKKGVDDFDEFANDMLNPEPIMRNQSNLNDFGNNMGLFDKNSAANLENPKVVHTKIVKETEDEFTDFQMSLPPTRTLPVLTVLPAEEKEKLEAPINHNGILQPIRLNNSNEISMKHTQIIWPDPGITDEELSRFECYSRQNDDVKQQINKNSERKLSGSTGLMLVEKSVVVPANKVVLPSKEVLLPPNDKVVISKDLVLPILESSPRKYVPIKTPRQDDDEFTDFMSSQDPFKSVKFGTNERTGTPELPLSIPQLSQMQAPKLPIPVITPQGLMQTKIPSSATSNQPKMQPPLHVNPPQDGFTPSIISQQFALQINQTSPYTEVFQNSKYQTTSIPSIMKTPTHQVSTINSTEINGINKLNSNFDDNDEWTEFVSSRPTTSSSNGLTNSNWPQQSNVWTSKISPPNVITNGGLNSVNTSMQTNKYNVSLSTLPELDFAAPRNKTYNKK